MNQKSKRFQTRMLTYGVLVVFCLIVIGIFIYSYISRYHMGKLDIKSRYTFSVVLALMMRAIQKEISKNFRRNGLMDI